MQQQQQQQQSSLDKQDKDDSDYRFMSFVTAAVCLAALAGGGYAMYYYVFRDEDDGGGGTGGGNPPQQGGGGGGAVPGSTTGGEGGISPGIAALISVLVCGALLLVIWFAGGRGLALRMRARRAAAAAARQQQLRRGRGAGGGGPDATAADETAAAAEANPDAAGSGGDGGRTRRPSLVQRLFGAAGGTGGDQQQQQQQQQQSPVVRGGGGGGSVTAAAAAREQLGQQPQTPEERQSSISRALSSIGAAWGAGGGSSRSNSTAAAATSTTTSARRGSESSAGSAISASSAPERERFSNMLRDAEEVAVQEEAERAAAAAVERRSDDGGPESEQQQQAAEEEAQEEIRADAAEATQMAVNQEVQEERVAEAAETGDPLPELETPRLGQKKTVRIMRHPGDLPPSAESDNPYWISLAENLHSSRAEVREKAEEQIADQLEEHATGKLVSQRDMLNLLLETEEKNKKIHEWNEAHPDDRGFDPIAVRIITSTELWSTNGEDAEMGFPLVETEQLATVKADFLDKLGTAGFDAKAAFLAMDTTQKRLVASLLSAQPAEMARVLSRRRRVYTVYEHFPRVVVSSFDDTAQFDPETGQRDISARERHIAQIWRERGEFPSDLDVIQDAIGIRAYNVDFLGRIYDNPRSVTRPVTSLIGSLVNDIRKDHGSESEQKQAERFTRELVQLGRMLRTRMESDGTDSGATDLVLGMLWSRAQSDGDSPPAEDALKFGDPDPPDEMQLKLFQVSSELTDRLRVMNQYQDQSAVMGAELDADLDPQDIHVLSLDHARPVSQYLDSDARVKFEEPQRGSFRFSRTARRTEETAVGDAMDPQEVIEGLDKYPVTRELVSPFRGFVRIRSRFSLVHRIRAHLNASLIRIDHANRFAQDFGNEPDEGEVPTRHLGALSRDIRDAEQRVMSNDSLRRLADRVHISIAPEETWREIAELESEAQEEAEEEGRRLPPILPFGGTQPSIEEGHYNSAYHTDFADDPTR